MATVSLITMETHESVSESENTMVLIEAAISDSEDEFLESGLRENAAALQTEENASFKVSLRETVTTETRHDLCHDLCHRRSIVKERLPVENIFTTPKNLLPSVINEEQHGSIGDDDDDDDEDDDDDYADVGDDDKGADFEVGYDNITDDAIDTNDDTILEGNLFCDNDDDDDDDDDEDGKIGRRSLIGSDQKPVEKEESNEKKEEEMKKEEEEKEEEETSKAGGGLKILRSCDLSTSSSKVPLGGNAAGKMKEPINMERNLVGKKENYSKVGEDENRTLKTDDSSSMHHPQNTNISNTPTSSEDTVFTDDGKNSEMNNGRSDSGVSPVDNMDELVTASDCVTVSKEETCHDPERLVSSKDRSNIPVSDGKLRVRKASGSSSSSSSSRKADAAADRGGRIKDVCLKPKCILPPLPAGASEFRANPPGTTCGPSVPTSQHGVGSAAAHRVLQRQRPAMAAPPTSANTHIPRLHRHCVMSYDDDSGASTGQSTSTSSSSSAPRVNGSSSSRVSPAQAGLRRESLEEDEGVGSLGQQQYVVNVHVNPGETFSVCVSDQVQLIQGPATVRMVSNNGPPLPMPMQVPPGHMVQQIIDENGILTNVILSSQPPGIPPHQMMLGYYGSASGTPPHVYSPYCPPYPPYHSQYAMHHHHHHPAPHMHHMAPPRMHGTSPPHHCNSHGHPSHLPTGHPPPPPPPPPPQSFHLNHSNMMTDDSRLSTKGQGRPQNRNYRSKVHRDRHCFSSASLQSTQQTRTTAAAPPLPPRANGVALRGKPHSESSSSDDPELEEERRVIQDILSKMAPPTVFDLEPRSALVVLTPPEVNQKDCDLESNEFQYELHLSEKKDGNYNQVYRVHSILDDIKSNQSESVGFKTLSCKPDPPQPPKLLSKTTTSLNLKWSAAAENGAKITGYVLESNMGQGDPSSFIAFVEIYNDLQRQFRVTKLNPSTRYTLRLAAVNAEGKSEYSDLVCYCTSGTAPTQPDPPMLSEQFVSSLTVSWIRRPKDDLFTLQMEDEATGRGFVSVCTDFNLSFAVQHLHRNTEYRFRLQASNEDGSSPWSDVVKYRTLPDKPQPPPRPQVNGKVHSHSFRVVWDSPKDSGGNEITLFVLQMDSGNGFESVYSGMVREFAADQLVPGHTYWLRVACVSSIGQSEWSDVLSVITQIVPPGQCTGLRLHGKPLSTTIHIKWAMPDFTGGAPFSDYEVLMTSPDSTACEVYRGPEMECAVTGLLPGRAYLFQVRCLNRAGAGPWSDSLEVVSGASVPDPPRQPTIVCRSPHSAHISWGEPASNGAPVTEYRLEYQQRDTEFSQLFCGLSITAEVSGLLSATMYSFRVQAVNSAGAGPFSAIASCVTPPSNPGTVTSVRASSTATSVLVTWKEPCDNGSKIVSYNMSIDDRTLIAVGNVLEYSADDLLPDTCYRVRVQAVNAIGFGGFSYPVKVMTRSLPPRPPVIECSASGYNSLKLKWKDARYQSDLLQYCLEMLRADGSFHPVFQGSGHSHKVNKLSELTQYEFRIYSSNAAGDGPYSEVFKFSTLKAPPGIVKALRVSSLAIDSGVADWLALKPMGADDIVYVLQLQAAIGRDQSFKEVYQGPETSFRLTGLSPGSEHRVRICAVRQTKDGTSVLVGPFSQTVTFLTETQKPASMGTTALGSGPPKSLEQRKLSDQQWAIVLLGCFTIFAIFLAFLANLIISQTTGNGSDTNDNPIEGKLPIDALE